MRLASRTNRRKPVPRVHFPPVTGLLLLAFLAAGGEVTTPGRATAAATAEVDSLVLLHTNDVHSHLDPRRASSGEAIGGAAARAALLARERARGGVSLTLDAGDVFQGTAYYNFFRGVPDYRVMSRMGYDLGALGNHDLDDGPLSWLRASRDARFPILSANVFVAAESAWAAGRPPVPAALRKGARWIGGAPVPESAPLRRLCEASVVRQVGGRRIAFLGLTTGDLPRIVSVGPNRGVAVSDPVAVAEALVPELRRKADVVIVLSHIGVEEGRRLARRVPGIDVIVGGHTHTLLKEPVFVPNPADENGFHGTAIVQAGSRGEWLGRTVLRFDGKRLTAVTGTVLPVRPGAGEDAGVERILEPYRDSISTRMAAPVFRTSRAYGTAGLKDGDTPLGNFVADALREPVHADIAIQNVGGIRGGIPKGNVTVGDLYSVLPFENRIVIVEMRGWQVRGLLDFIARRIGKGGFAQVSGVRFTIRRDRASDIGVGGKPLDPNRTYRVATIDFLYDGGDGFTAFAKAGPAEDTGREQREAAIDFLRRRPQYRFEDDGRIRWEGSTGALRDLRMR
jgi:2',3'-cyclic-nucleotide 2'-phosphodiesterase (5'-nucleotidase family)